MRHERGRRPDGGLEGLRYRFCGLTLLSNTSFPELAPLLRSTSSIQHDIVVRLSDDPVVPPSPAHRVSEDNCRDGSPWLACAKTDQGYFLQFHELADFALDAKGREIACAPHPGTPPETIRHLLLDTVLPLTLTLRGQDALHATAVQTPHGVCAFTGPSGRGKSTMAASFLSSGCPMLGDDCLLLHEADGTIWATPSYPGLRLWDDALAALGMDRRASRPVAHYASKRRPVIPHSKPFSYTAQPLARIYSLIRRTEKNGSPPSEPRIEPLSSRAGFVELLGSMFILDRTDRAMWLRQFHFLERLMSRVSVKRLHVPNRFDSLPAIQRLVLEDMLHG